MYSAKGGCATSFWRGVQVEVQYGNRRQMTSSCNYSQETANLVLASKLPVDQGPSVTGVKDYVKLLHDDQLQHA